MWCGPPLSQLTAARFAEIAEAGFTTVANACAAKSFEPDYNRKMLELANGAGLKAHVSDSRVFSALGKSDLGARLAPVLADYSNAPALLSYHVKDEPGADAFGALAALRTELEERDPAHYASINLLPNYASNGQLQSSSYDEYVRNFLTIVKPKSFTYDHYNFNADGTDGGEFFSNLAYVRKHSVTTGIPFGQYIQSISYVGHRATNGPEKLWAGLSTLAYGGRGVLYFTYWTPAQTAENFGEGIITAAGERSSQYNDVKANNVILHAIGRYLSKAVSTKVFHNVNLPRDTQMRAPGDIVYIPSDKNVFVGLFEVNTDAYALVVNGTHNADVQTDVVFASTTRIVNVLNVTTGEFEPVSGTAEPHGLRVTVSLGKGNGQLYHIVSPATQGPPGAEGYLGVVRRDEGRLHVVDSNFGSAPMAGASWDSCPTGTTNIGKSFESNGFWFCARSDLVNRTFYVGNVVNDTGNLYSLKNGTVTHVGQAEWAQPCPTESLFIGRRFESNGFWVCMD